MFYLVKKSLITKIPAWKGQVSPKWFFFRYTVHWVQYMYMIVRYTEKKSFYQKHPCNHRSVLTGIKGDIKSVFYVIEKSGFLMYRKSCIYSFLAFFIWAKKRDITFYSTNRVTSKDVKLRRLLQKRLSVTNVKNYSHHCTYNFI